MKRTVVIDIVGLSNRMVGTYTPFLKKWSDDNPTNFIKPLVPAVTCSMQSTYLTGSHPDKHGIVGNGWYFRDECEVKFWKQSNTLVQSPKIWELAAKTDPDFTCANLFWWYNMYSEVDYSVTPRPNYLADGRKIPDVYSNPPELREELQESLGQFPLFEFWGPRTSIRSSQWIADAAKYTENKYKPTLTLIYLPHLDYCLQKFGHDFDKIGDDLKDIDALVESLVTFYQHQGVTVVLLSEYGITEVSNPVALNRVLRKSGWLQVREERGLELLDAGASKAFAVADHQVAHIYVKHQSDIPKVRQTLEQVAGVEAVWGKEEKQSNHLNHERAGDLVAVANPESWFTYYYWLDENKAPDFARTVDIHRKPGYDPVEMFADPQKNWITARVGYKLLKKKLGFRVLMDIIPLDATLIKGSHGIVPSNIDDWPMIISSNLADGESIEATDVYQVIWDQLQA